MSIALSSTASVCPWKVATNLSPSLLTLTPNSLIRSNSPLVASPKASANCPSVLLFADAMLAKAFISLLAVPIPSLVRTVKPCVKSCRLCGNPVASSSSLASSAFAAL